MSTLKLYETHKQELESHLKLKKLMVETLIYQSKLEISYLSLINERKQNATNPIIKAEFKVLCKQIEDESSVFRKRIKENFKQIFDMVGYPQGQDS